MATPSGNLFDDNNPFADPSIRAASAPRQADMEYNPFVPPTQAPRPSTTTPTQPAVLAPTGGAGGAGDLGGSFKPPPYSQQAGIQISNDELERRQRELAAKEADLQRREQEMAARNLAGSSGVGGARAPGTNNFPPLPSWFCVQPCFYQDIDVEIPPQYQLSVKWAFRVWLAHPIVYLLNVLGALAYFIGMIATNNTTQTSVAGQTFGFSILCFVILAPCSYVCWFRPLYNAFRSDSSLYFFIFFIISLIQIGILIVWAIGIPGWYSVGFINGLGVLGAVMIVGIIMIVIGILAAVLAAFDILLLIAVHRHYRSSGFSLEKARAEMASSNAFRGAVSAGAGMAARSAFDSFGNTNQQQGGSGSGATGGGFRQ